MTKEIELIAFHGYGAGMDLSRDFSEPLLMLMVGIIDLHIMDCDCEDVMDGRIMCTEKCCELCCAPCSGLAWLRDNANDALTVWLNDWEARDRAEAMKRFPDEDWSEAPLKRDWQNPDGSVNWEMIEWHWGDCPNHEDD